MVQRTQIERKNGKVEFKNTDRDVIQLRPFKSLFINMNLQANEIQSAASFSSLTWWQQRFDKN